MQIFLSEIPQRAADHVGVGDKLGLGTPVDRAQRNRLDSFGRAD
jgi:hypothetical protein